MNPVLAQLRAEVRAPNSQAVAIQLAGAGLSFIAYFAIARLFGAATVGQYAILVQTVVTAATVALFGRDQAAARAIATAIAQGRRASARAQLWAQGRRASAALILAGLALLLAAPLLRRIGVESGVAVLVGPITVLYGTLRFLGGALRGAGSVRAAQTVMALQPAVMLAAIAVVLIGLTTTNRGLGWGYLASLLVPAAIAALLVAKASKAWGDADAAPVEPVADRRLSYGMSIIITTVFGWALLASLGLLFDRAAMGLYQVCLQLQLPFAMVMTTYVLSFTPDLARLLDAGDTAATNQFLRDRGRALLAVTLPPLVLLAIFAEPVLLLFGEEFGAGAAALRVFTLGSMASMVWGFATTVLYMAHRDGAYLLLTLASILVSIAVLAVLAPVWGLVGVAAAYVSQAFLMHGLAAVLARRVIDGG